MDMYSVLDVQKVILCTAAVQSSAVHRPAMYCAFLCVFVYTAVCRECILGSERLWENSKGRAAGSSCLRKGNFREQIIFILITLEVSPIKANNLEDGSDEKLNFCQFSLTVE